MFRTAGENNERVFTIELRSKGSLRNASFDGDQGVCIEGSIGSLQRAQFVDDLVLRIVGDQGELRIDLGSKDIEGSIEKPMAEEYRDKVGA